MLTPAKLFDPIFGPRVISGFIITSDFMSFCSYRPIARTGDLVLVIGIATWFPFPILVEVGTIISGCPDVRTNAPPAGNSQNFPTDPFNLDPNAPVSPRVTAQVDDFFNSNPSTDSVFPFIKNMINELSVEASEIPYTPDPNEQILQDKASRDPNLPHADLKDKIDLIPKKVAQQLEEKLKKGMCGGPPIEITNDVESNGSICKDTPIKYSMLADPKTVSMGLGQLNPVAAKFLQNNLVYINLKIRDFFQKFSDSDLQQVYQQPYVQTEDALLNTIQTEIEVAQLIKMVSKGNDLLNLLPDTQNAEEDIQLANNLPRAFNFINTNIQEFNKKSKISIQPVVSVTKESIFTKVNEINVIKTKIQTLINEPTIDKFLNGCDCDSDIKQLFGTECDDTRQRYLSLKPVTPDEMTVCPVEKKPITVNPEACEDVNDIIREVNKGISSIVGMLNGNPDEHGYVSENNFGLIANSLKNSNIQNIKQATAFASGRMDTADGLIAFRDENLRLIDNSRPMTQFVIDLLKFTRDISSEIKSILEQVKILVDSTTKGTDPASIATDTAICAVITTLLVSAVGLSLSIPSSAHLFQLQDAGLAGGLTNFNFLNINPGNLPGFSALLVNAMGAIHIPTIDAMMTSGIGTTQSNKDLMTFQLDNIAYPRMDMLNLGAVRITDLVDFAVAMLMSLKNCLRISIPTFNLGNFGINFDLGFTFQFGIPFPKIKIPRLNFNFPTDFTLNIPFTLPTLALNFKLKLPRIKLPRLPGFPKIGINLPNLKINWPHFKLPSFKLNFPHFALNIKFPKLPNLKIRIPFRIPNFKIPQFNLKLPNFKLPRFKFKFRFKFKLGRSSPFGISWGGIGLPKFPFKFHIKLPKLNMQLGLQIQPLILDLPKLSLPFPINLKLPSINLPTLPFLELPNFKIGLPSIKFGLELPQLPQIAIAFPAITIPSLCPDSKNGVPIIPPSLMFNKLLLQGGSGGRPMAFAMCSMWVSPNFVGWITPIPCQSLNTLPSKCNCMI